MKRATIRQNLGVAGLFVLACLSTVPGIAQQPSHAEPLSPPPASSDQALLAEEIAQPGQVVIEGRPVLTVYESVATLTPEERARGIESRIVSIARNSGESPDAIRLAPHDAWTEIVLGNTVILAVTDADAKAAGRPRQDLALRDMESIRQTIRNYRRDHSWRLILRGMLYTVLVTLVLLIGLWLVRRAQLVLRERIQRQIYTSAHLEKKSAWHVSVAYLGPIALALGAIVRWVLILGLVEAYLTVALGFFSATREISLTVTNWVFSQLGSMGRALLDYLPNLLVLTVIGLVTTYAVRLVRLVFGEIQKGEVKIRGFYPDWAEPTEKLVRLLIFVLALIVAFPYLPGAKSPAFQGISIFLGLLLSLGSSSAVANAIAGTILTYMRSFLVGDWVQIGDTTGEVIEKTLLVTRILTPKAEIITIPNSAVMSGSVKNFSVEAKKSGVIFHTTATIGYDAPWRTVHQLLVNAALATNHVLHQPTPFVLQTGLNDFYVAYELNAYTDAPREMLNIYSELHQNIQDKFNEAGVEICSPHFSSLRDGNTIAIPEQYIRPEYKAPGFRLHPGDTNGTRDAVTDRVETPGKVG
jgi:small-conductance mechanosensitive channel